MSDLLLKLLMIHQAKLAQLTGRIFLRNREFSPLKWNYKDPSTQQK